MLQWGLIDELAPPDALDDKVFEFARRLAAQPKHVVPHYMKILRAVEAGELDAANRLRDEARRTMSGAVES